MYSLEAGVELLIRTQRVYENAPWVEYTSADRAYIDTSKLTEHMGAWSGGEQRVARIALSLMSGSPVDLREELAGLDREYLSLVLAAVAHAGGSHEQSEPTFEEGGYRGNTSLPALYEWPSL